MSVGKLYDCDGPLKEQPMVTPRDNFAIDLFSGAGGLSLGLKQSGIRISSAVEIDRDSARTYRLNHPEVELIESDIIDIIPQNLASGGPQTPLAIVAGSPCQGYSAAGRRDPSCAMNGLFMEVVRIAEPLEPRFIVIENVPGLRRVNGIGFTDRVCGSLRDIGYVIEGPFLLRSEDFGVPQKRRRLVFMAQHRRYDAPLLPPAATHEYSGDGFSPLARTPSLEEVLADLPELDPGCNWECGEYGGKMVYNASTMAHSQKVIDKISMIGPGEGPISYRRLERTLARTLVAGHRALPVHPWLDRTISVREAARIQGFPDDFVFAGPRSNQPLQVANAVPVPMARAIGIALLGASMDSLSPTTSSGKLTGPSA